jgi:hypothetical protein
MKILVAVILCLSASVFAADKMSKRIVVETDGYFLSYGKAVNHCDSEADQARAKIPNASRASGTTLDKLNVSVAVDQGCEPLGPDCTVVYGCKLQFESYDANVGFGTTPGPKEKGKGSLDRCHQDELTLQSNPTILLTGISSWRVFFRSHCAAYGVGVGRM